MIKESNNFWCEDSNFVRSKVNFHARIVDLGAKIKVGEKLRIFKQCAWVGGGKQIKLEN